MITVSLNRDHSRLGIYLGADLTHFEIFWYIIRLVTICNMNVRVPWV